MSLIYLDGFDDRTYIDTYREWVTAVGDDYCHGNYSRWATGQGIRLDSDSDWHYLNLPGNYSSLVLGIAYYINDSTDPTYSTGDSDGPFLAFYDVGTLQMNLKVVGNDLRFYNNSESLLGTVSNWHEKYTWRYLELVITFNSSTGSVEVYKDNALKGSLTSINNAQSGNNYCNRVYLSVPYYNVESYYDDLYIDDSTRHGPCRIQTFFPDGAGTYSQFTPSAGSNYECVDEIPPNNDTDYVSTDTELNKDTYTITTGSLNEVKGISLGHKLKKTDAFTMRSKHLLRSNGANYFRDSIILGTSYKHYPEIWESDPDDSNPWTQTKLEAAEFGLMLATSTTTTTTV